MLSNDLWLQSHTNFDHPLPKSFATESVIKIKLNKTNPNIKIFERNYFCHCNQSWFARIFQILNKRLNAAGNNTWNKQNLLIVKLYWQKNWTLNIFLLGKYFLFIVEVYFFQIKLDLLLIFFLVALFQTLWHFFF